MGALDDIRSDAEDVMKDIPPEQQQKIQQIAQEKGIPLDKAKEFLDSQGGNGQNQGQPQGQQQSENQNQQSGTVGNEQGEEDDRNL